MLWATLMNPSNKSEHSFLRSSHLQLYDKLIVIYLKLIKL
jgi:hypothetical protein